MTYLEIKENLKLLSELDEKIIGQFINDHRFNQMIILLCIDGEMEISIDMKTFRIVSSSMLTILPDLNVKLESITDNFHCYMVSIQRELLTKAFYVKNITPIETILLKKPFINLDKDRTSLFMQYFSFLIQINDRINDKHPEIIRCHLMSLLMSLKAIYRERILDNDEEILTRGKIISHDFIKLVRKHHTEEHHLKFYAEKLCITPKYLMSVVKKHLGHNPKIIIDEALLADAKFMLESSDLCIKQICDKLNFPNPSFFARFFKQHVGVNPRDYRNGRIKIPELSSQTKSE